MYSLKDRSVFVFDIESIGIYGDAFAVGGGWYTPDGLTQLEFVHACNKNSCRGSSQDRYWVDTYVPHITVDCHSPKYLRSIFWNLWTTAREHNAIMLVDCGYPCETTFLRDCIADDIDARSKEGPYPLYDLSSILAMCGKDPLITYERLENELPRHHPLMDSRQTFRLFRECIQSHE
jgi:hypothetical protein